MLHVSLPPSFRRASPLLPPIPPPDPSSSPPMSISLRSHAFSGNPLRSSHPPPPLLLADNPKGAAFDSIKVLPFRKGRVLARSEESSWRLCWLRPSELGANWPADASVFLGADRGGTGHWAVDMSRCDVDLEGGGVGRAFVELRTLMVATDWADESLMAELAVAGHAKALIEWHATSHFCGHCGARTKTIDAGKRKQCTEESCKKRVYPRVDPVVIMLVIDKENDRALLSHQARFVPRMWSCLAGFIEPGESLEEAVRRETLEETGIEVGKVVYHSSQPWPVGPSSMPCQLMVGFFAYAESFDIKVDKKELDDARWYSKEDVRKALTFTEYERAQKTSALKVKQMCQGIQRDQSLASDLNVDSELAPMFVPGPYAIAHHLISSWVHNNTSGNDFEPFSASPTSLSNL